MQLLDVASGETVVQLHQKGMSKESWPALQLTCDEALLAHMVNNTVNIYKTKAFAEGDNAVMSAPHTLCLALFGQVARCPCTSRQEEFLQSKSDLIFYFLSSTICLHLYSRP